MAGIEGRPRPRIETSGTPSNAGCVSSGSPSPVSGAATGGVARTLGRSSTQRSGSNMTAAMSTPQQRIGVNPRTSRRWTTEGRSPARSAAPCGMAAALAGSPALVMWVGILIAIRLSWLGRRGHQRPPDQSQARICADGPRSFTLPIRPQGSVCVDRVSEVSPLARINGPRAGGRDRGWSGQCRDGTCDRNLIAV